MHLLSGMYYSQRYQFKSLSSQSWLRYPCLKFTIFNYSKSSENCSEAEFNEYGWFLFKLYSIFQDLSWRFIETSFVGIWGVAQIY